MNKEKDEDNKKYGVIYADPPWKYMDRRSAERHYPTMSIDEICKLPVEKIADKDCVLFMWITFPQLFDAIKVVRAWGFAYKTAAFVWIKQNKVADTLFCGLGHWTRSNAEVCIIATKGKPKRVDARVRQVVISHIEEHSKKPQIVRDRIKQLMGDVPMIELFARQKTDGWDTWGNEIENSIEL